MRKDVTSRRVVTYGFLTWLIPFTISIFFFNSNGHPIIPMEFFKSIMIVAGATTGAWFFVRVFHRIEGDLVTGVVIGVFWLVMNLGLDLLILVPMSQMGLTEYFFGTGLRYLIIPIMGAALGTVATAKQVAN